MYSKKENWRVCGGADRPEFTFELSRDASLKVSTIGVGSTTTVYLTVVTKSQKSIELKTESLTVRSPKDKTEVVELVKQSWSSEEFINRYGPFYQIFTGSIEILGEEEKLTLNFPQIIIDERPFEMEQILFVRKSGIGWDTCGQAW